MHPTPSTSSSTRSTRGTRSSQLHSRSSSVEDDSRPRLQSSNTQDVYDTISSTRKSYKTLRGGERVWPPELEAALIEGLENYQPDDSRETTLLGRFPLRNRFISDYIFQKTGQHRTPKQVGSRLQQLRESGGGSDRLQSLLRPRRTPGAVPSNYNYRRPSPLSREVADSDGTVIASEDCNASEDLPQSVHWIDILPEDVSEYQFASSSSQDTDDEYGLRLPPRHLRTIDPTLAFTYGESNIEATSECSVFLDGSIFVHRESTPLVFHRQLDESAFIYTTYLVPKFWDTIVGHRDPTSFTICQTIIDSRSTQTIYSAKYGFRYPDEVRRARSGGDINMGFLESVPPFRDGYESPSWNNFSFSNEIMEVTSSDSSSDHRSPESSSDSMSEGGPRSPLSDTFPISSSSSAPAPGLCLPPALSFYI